MELNNFILCIYIYTSSHATSKNMPPSSRYLMLRRKYERLCLNRLPNPRPTQTDASNNMRDNDMKRIENSKNKSNVEKSPNDRIIDTDDKCTKETKTSVCDGGAILCD